jgi:site-specific DNA-methyltransferase (adenine-specific)
MKPYYEHGRITIYHGDCREILPRVDLVLTDPPYGINLGETSGAGGGHGLKLSKYSMYVDSYDNFVNEIVPALNNALDMATRGIIFSGPHIHEQRKPDAIGGIFCSAAQGRHCWGFKNFLPVLFYGNAPGLNLGSKQTMIASNELPDREKAGNSHPVPKPIGWMTWLVNLGSRSGETILDPFMGSGTTLRAAKDLGRKAIGIEIEEKYCDIAVKRLQQEVFNF